MRISIEHGETTTGFIFKKTLFTVRLAVQFSEEELAIIKLRKLESDVLVERDPPADVSLRNTDNPNIFHLTIGKLVKKGSDTYVVSTPIEAKNYEMLLHERLKLLKEYIMGNADGGTSKTYEL